MIFAAVPILQPPELIPEVWPTWTRCSEELLIVDNTPDRAWEEIARLQGWSYVTFQKNIGLAGGWNIARAKFMADTKNDHDLLLLFSASVQWLDGLDVVLDQVSAAANWKGCQGQLGFHAIAWSRRLFEIAGDFDEACWPAGFYTDNDFAWRLILAGILVADPDPMPHVDLAVSPVENALAIRSLGVEGNYGACRDYYKAKWGGEPSHETFTTPFDSGLPTSWWSLAYRPGLEQVDIGVTRYRDGVAPSE